MKKLVFLIPLSFLMLSGCTSDDVQSSVNVGKKIVNTVSKDGSNSNQTAELPSSFNGLSEMNPDTCSLSGSRQKNVVADIGAGDRQYYARTNEYGQVVEAYAADIEIQDDKSEDVKSSGRYCNDEAKVPGIEDPDLDEGHMIADSLGGESNAYNITPQDSYLNRRGEQYQMEDEIREAEQNGQDVTNFDYKVTYPNTRTQTPSKYSVSYDINGNSKTISFNNK